MLPFVTLTLHVEMEHPLRLPEHAGSMLRGAFGNALRKLACITRQRDCETCPLMRSCPYPQLFEYSLIYNKSNGNAGPQAVNPYVIRPPAMGQKLFTRGESWSFEFTVLGRAIDQLPLLVYAWQQACVAGFGKSQSKASLQQITQGETVVYEPNGALSATPQPLLVPVLGDSVRLNFLTPVRFQHQGHVVLVRDQLTADIVLMTLAYRIQALSSQHTPQPMALDLEGLRQYASRIRLEATGLRRHGVQRFSSRQKQVITLDGLIGEVRLSGPLQPFAELLAFGQYTHIGKNATHGLGVYELLDVKPVLNKAL